MYSLKRSFRSAITTTDPSIKNVSIIGISPESDCWQFRFVSLRQGTETLPVPHQRFAIIGLRDVVLTLCIPPCWMWI